MNKKSLFTLLVLLACATSSFAASWVQVSKSQYVDETSIKPSHSYGTYTFKAKAVADGTPFERHNGKDIWQVTSSMYVDCRDAYIREISYSLYDSSSRLVASNKTSGNQWRNIGPGNTTHDLYAYVCRSPVAHYNPNFYNKYNNYYYRWWD